ncbi:PilZ domain-containing protein [Roseibium sp. SCP14]|uniref:PilZ domain-containing protein n=1 Tax=Roseibium sp. SCP14 TaxID=3141375 RepID=UPI00333B144C
MSGLAVAKCADGGVSALIVDLADMSCFDAVVHDLSDRGCRIVSAKTDLTGKEVGLRFPGIDMLVRGWVTAYGDNEARVSFKGGKVKPAEKRREIRRPVWISAVVSGQTNPITMKCRIVDASKSGCRLEGDKLDRLPEHIHISIPGLDLPIKSVMVWRNGNQAGVKLDWPFEPEAEPTPEMLLKQFDEELEKQKSKPKPRKRISAFGR